jgi:preprotein translocase subunit SecG
MGATHLVSMIELDSVVEEAQPPSMAHQILGDHPPDALNKKALARYTPGFPFNMPGTHPPDELPWRPTAVILFAFVSQYFFGISLFVLSLFMILLVLVQRGRGGGLTGALGGPGGQSAFGTKAGDLFTRITIITASLWIFICALAVWSLQEKALPTMVGSSGQSGTSASGSISGVGEAPPDASGPVMGQEGTATPSNPSPTEPAPAKTPPTSGNPDAATPTNPESPSTARPTLNLNPTVPENKGDTKP